MNNLLNILKGAQKVLFCPVCKRKYELGEIKLRGFFDNIYILQTSCTNNHGPIIMTVIVHNYREKKTLRSQQKYISNQDINELKNTLDNFNGDFKNLWKK